MAIKVIKTEPHNSVVKEHVCKHCGSTLQYTPVDVKERRVSDYLGDIDVFEFIVCPVCNDKQTVGRL